MFKGIYVALITPFKDDLSVDYETLEKLIDFHLENNTDGIVVCGTTGEAATLTIDEYEKVIKFVNDKVSKRIKVIAGIGSNDTKKTINNLKIVEKIGVDGVLLVSPYYNKPSGRALYEYFSNIAEITKLPIILYDIPGRTGVKIPNDVIYELSKKDNIVGIKDATGDIMNVYEIYKKCGKDFSILSGDDEKFYPQLSLGCTGTISVLANTNPREMKEMMEKFKNSRIEDSFVDFQKLQKIATKLFIEGNPVTIKAYMYLKGMIPNMKVRSPLLEVDESTIRILKEIL